MKITFPKWSDQCQTNPIIDLTCQSANLPPLVFTSKCLFTLWCTVAPPGLLVSQQQNNAVMSATPTTQVRTTVQTKPSLIWKMSDQTRKWAAILLICRFLADGWPLFSPLVFILTTPIWQSMWAQHIIQGVSHLHRSPGTCSFRKCWNSDSYNLIWW